MPTMFVSCSMFRMNASSRKSNDTQDEGDDNVDVEEDKKLRDNEYEEDTGIRTCATQQHGSHTQIHGTFRVALWEESSHGAATVLSCSLACSSPSVPICASMVYSGQHDTPAASRVQARFGPVAMCQFFFLSVPPVLCSTCSC